MKLFLWITFVLAFGFGLIGCDVLLPARTEQERFIQKGMRFAAISGPAVEVRIAVVDSATAEPMTYQELETRYNLGQMAGVDTNMQVWVVVLNGYFSFISGHEIGGPISETTQRVFVFSGVTGDLMVDHLGPLTSP